ncbi:MAG TPA: glutamyl-tRNA reductase [Armatimonadota bacterium]|nr:glutamyl-tRNA reductase [Armatimonadota bacterium]HPO72740.1 glutamyl-tRNA reductase [Armatimonadota bacterium]
MRVILVGANHQTAPLAVRERLAFTKASLAPALLQLREGGEIEEAAILATCNRTEVYAAGRQASVAPILRLFRARGVSERELTPCLYTRHDEDAIRHLHRVAAGLESMILGEAQILGQVKAAWCAALDAGAVGPVLDRLFRSAVTAGKRVRAETGLARGAVSVGHAAVELARRTFGQLEGLHAMVLGAGEMSKVAARLLVDAGVASLTVANRTLERAQDLAAELGARAIRVAEFGRHVGKMDIVICSTAAPHPVVRAETLRPMVAARRDRPLLLVDIAVPRDVEPAVGNLENVHLFTIDDLQSIVQENLAGRAAEVEAAEAIVAEEAAKLVEWLRCFQVGPVLAALQRKGESVVQDELAKIEGRLRHLSDRDRELIGVLARGVARRLLREPILAVKRLAATEEPRPPLETVQELFGLSDVGAPTPDPAGEHSD